MKLCLGCGSNTNPSRNGSGKFCNNACQVLYRKATYITKWLSGDEDGSTKYGISDFVRNHLLEAQKGRCSDCGRKTWNGQPIHLEVEHNDGNWRNNSPDNVRMICPNCHSQTPTYKAKNKERGFGRDWRSRYPRRWDK